MKKGYKICPFCANEIKESAIKCRYCKEMLDGETELGKVRKTIKKDDFEEIGEGNLLNGRTFLSILSCQGRLTRGEYRLYMGIGFFAYLLGCFVLGVIIGFLTGDISDLAANTIAYTLLIPRLCWSVPVRIGRAHDRGKPRTYILLLLVPFINIFVGIELFFCKSDNKTNKYGKEPHKVSNIVTATGVILRIISIVFIILSNSL